MSGNVDPRKRLISLLKTRSASLEFKLQFLRDCAQDELTFSARSRRGRHTTGTFHTEISGRPGIAGSHLLHEHVKCTPVRNELRPILPERTTHPHLRPKPSKKHPEQGTIVRCHMPVSFVGGRGRHLDEFASPLARVEVALDEIHNVYHIGSYELNKRTLSAIEIGKMLRGFLIRTRHMQYTSALRGAKMRGASGLLSAVVASLVHCREIDLGVSRLLRRRRRKLLFKHWRAMSSTSIGPEVSRKQKPRVTSIFRPDDNDERSQTDGRTVQPVEQQTAQTTHVWANNAWEHESSGLSIDSIVNAASMAAEIASRHARRLVSKCMRQAIRVRAIVSRAQAVEEVILFSIMRTWQHWVRIQAEGRLALVLVNSSNLPKGPQGSQAHTLCLLQKNISPGLKQRFSAPHDIQAAARIARCSRLRRYCGAWRSRSALLREVHLRRRRKLSQFVRAQLKAWHTYAIKLQAARYVAVGRWRSHLLARLSRPLSAWYLWAHARIVQRKDTERVVSAFTRLKRRHVAAVTLRAWRHAAELNRLEARYTRRQLMGALAEQKGHVRRLERLTEDLDMTRAELDNAADLAHERSAKLARNALVRDDDCKFLESRLESAENDVALAQRVLSSVDSDRSAITQHIVRMQPIVGFSNHGLSDLARDRDARLGAGVSSSLGNASTGDFMSSRNSSSVEGLGGNTSNSLQSAGFVLSNTIAGTNGYEDVSGPSHSGSQLHQPIQGEADAHDDVIELPAGMALIRHPNETGGLMLCRRSVNANRDNQERDYLDGGADVTKTSFAIRLNWLLATVNSTPPLIEFTPLTHVIGTPLFKDNNTTRVGKKRDLKEVDDVQCDNNPHMVAGDGEGTNLADAPSSFTPLQDVPFDVVENAALGLLSCVRNMYGLFEFLRDGDRTALPEKLLSTWNATALESRKGLLHNQDRRWKHLTQKARAPGVNFKWRDMYQHIGAHLLRGRPCETKPDRMAQRIVESINRANLTYITLYSGATRHLRPNTYAFQAQDDDFTTVDKIKLWDSSG